MGEHAEGIQLTAKHGHLCIGKGGPTLGHRGSVHHDGGAVAYTKFLGGYELNGLLTSRCLRAKKHGSETVQRDALGPIDHRGRKIVVA